MIFVVAGVHPFWVADGLFKHPRIVFASIIALPHLFLFG
jgi:hypothetical protein